MTATYDAAFQTKIIAMALRDEQFMQRCEGLIDPAYFDFETHSYLADMANRHYADYRSVLDASIVIKQVKDAKDAKLIKDDFVDDLKKILKTVYSAAIDLSNRDYMVDEVAKFAKERAIEGALERSIDIVDKKGNYGDIENLVKEALATGANEGSGSVSFFDNVAARVKARVDRLRGSVTIRGITTGHKELDDLLFHKGWGRKELALLLGAAKAGKSMGLQHFAIKACEAGYKVLYITCENSAEVTCDRIDSAVSGVQMKDLDVSATTVQTAVVAMGMKGGMLEVREFPMGTCKVSDIRRVIRKYQAKGVIFDMLVVDYADEMAAERRYNDERHALKEVYTGLRALCTEENLAGLTATQTNRSGAKATTATGTDVAEDFGKIRVADAVISINASEDERKRGELRLYLSHMRNSEGGITLHCSSDRSRMCFIKRVLKVA